MLSLAPSIMRYQPFSLCADDCTLPNIAVQDTARAAANMTLRDSLVFILFASLC